MSSDELKVPSQQQRNDVQDNDYDHDNDHDRDRDRDRDALRDDPVDGDELARSEARTENLARHDDEEEEEGTGRGPRDGDEHATVVPDAAVPGTAVPGAPVPVAPAPGASGPDDEASYRDPYARTDGDMLAEPDPAHVTPGSHAAPDDIVLFDQDPTEVQARWRDLQSSFVDDPGQAVQRADGLVNEVVESLTSTLSNRTNALRDRWKETGSTADTEQLRLALRDYRTVLERLLALSSKSPAQPAQTTSQPDPFQSQGMR
ncbi:hypothetical protein HD597_006298 [Nonomuraea thailandensis]|uniref:Uncharacterized protein n=1 Tax=Nonomuraea thailandensis TaxID=1188745 RepID=A0A9X2GRS7_9ACTN|nr:hypothetical protein [Nonomuraea thailandensis]MCP2359278.1 hypothetical protein [Nonomuraea thailandensis]